MSICAGVVVAVAFEQVDGSPDAETCTEGDNEGLKNGYCAVEKCHIRFLLDRKQGWELLSQPIMIERFVSFQRLISQRDRKAEVQG